MNSGEVPRGKIFETIRRYTRAKAPVEMCELCSVPLAREHPHLVEPANRKLLCACDACAILFSAQGGKYRRVPRRSRHLAGFQLSDLQWESLMIPINMAFFFYSSSAAKVVALYPSPGGPIESLLPLDCWQEIVKNNHVLTEMEPDVEALLVLRGMRPHEKVTPEYYLVPIDECYKLVGLIRAHWRGLSGGAQVWGQIAAFFAGLKERSIPETSAVQAKTPR